eukprot:XP_011672898.1 PREDICTED: uncharacterized protein LOC105442464 [Strongylocentrotus purpuratus]
MGLKTWTVYHHSHILVPYPLSVFASTLNAPRLLLVQHRSIIKPLRESKASPDRNIHDSHRNKTIRMCRRQHQACLQPPAATSLQPEGKELFIAWIENRDPSPTKNGMLEILDDFSLAIKNVTTSDAGKYFCKVSDDRGHLIWNKTDLQVAVPPMKPFPLIDLCTPPGLNDSSQCQLRVDNSSTVELSCTANGASAGLTTLYWTHNGSVISSEDKMTISSNADGTENVTSTITAHPSNIPFICVATLNVTKVVTSTTSVIIKPSTTDDSIKHADNHIRNTVLAVIGTMVLLGLAVTSVWQLYKKKDRLCGGPNKEMAA